MEREPIGGDRGESDRPLGVFRSSADDRPGLRGLVCLGHSSHLQDSGVDRIAGSRLSCFGTWSDDQRVVASLWGDPLGASGSLLVRNAGRSPPICRSLSGILGGAR